MDKSKRIYKDLVRRGVVDTCLCDKPRCNYVRKVVTYDKDGYPSVSYFNTFASGHICEKLHIRVAYHDFLLRLGVNDCC